MGNQTNDLGRLKRWRIEDSSGWQHAATPSKDGTWVRHEDVMGLFAYIEGYLLEHQNMLSHIGVHTKIVKAVEALREDLKTALKDVAP